ncbi:MAG TPA: glycosyltransferase family 2 protein [Planctomycetota bacterium]|nr:glycosyltransferase family 2 protein [Planctomycetota bacterium]
MRSSAVAVVIPAYKAQAHIVRVLEGIPELVRHIIVVDDASPDDTGRLVSERNDPRVTLVRHAENQGVGAAVMTGYAKALELGAEIVVKMDADDQMDPGRMMALLGPIVRGDADYAKGNRFLHRRELSDMPFVRRLGNMGLSFLTKLASGYWNVFDPTNGYTAIHRTALALLDRERIDRRYFFETNMLIELGFLRAVVSDVPMPARYGDETSSLSVKMVLLEFPPRLFRAFVRRITVQYFVRDFTALSVLLVGGSLLLGFGVAWGAYHWIAYHLIHASAPTGTIMIAVLPILIGIQMLLQAVVLDVQGVPQRPISRQEI